MSKTAAVSEWLPNTSWDTVPNRITFNLDTDFTDVSAYEAVYDVFNLQYGMMEKFYNLYNDLSAEDKLLYPQRVQKYVSVNTLTNTSTVTYTFNFDCDYNGANVLT